MAGKLNFAFTHADADAIEPAAAPAKGWATGLGQCGGSWKLSCIVLSCLPCSIGQVFERSGAGACAWVGWLLSVLALLALVAFVVAAALFASHAGALGMYSGAVVAAVGGLAALVGALVAAVVVCVVRHRVRKLSAIAPREGADCAAAFLCAPFVVCQLFRQMDLDPDDEMRPFRPCSTTGDGFAWTAAV